MIPPVDLSRITIDQLTLPVLQEKKMEASVLRLDKIHPLISGNKWFKLKKYLEEAQCGGWDERSASGTIATVTGVPGRNGVWNGAIVRKAPFPSAVRFRLTSRVCGRLIAPASSLRQRRMAISNSIVRMCAVQQRQKGVRLTMLGD